MAGQRIKDFKKIHSPDEILNRVQDQIGNSVSQLLRTEILDGRLIKNVQLRAGDKISVEHKLDRAPIGWFIVRKRSEASVWDSQDDNLNPTRFLDLQSGNTASVDIWVF